MLRRLLPATFRARMALSKAVEIGRAFGQSIPPNKHAQLGDVAHSNDLRRFFDGHKKGQGIWKWEHYFEVYDKHLAKFRGRQPRILEIGIYSGGSLQMWKEYFGADAMIFGVDIEPACKVYEGPGVQVLIGDQADRSFWARFRREISEVDIVIDDGGHLPVQQIVSLEELIPHMRPGGVYICEDIHGIHNEFAEVVYGFASCLNAASGMVDDHNNPERRISVPTNAVQSAISGVSLYPFLSVIELSENLKSELVAPKHGTDWEPFLK